MTTTMTHEPIPECLSGDFYFLPSDTNCEEYWICADGTFYNHSCAPGIHFNRQISKCDYPEKANCPLFASTTDEDTTTEDTTTEEEDDGIIPTIPSKRVLSGSGITGYTLLSVAVVANLGLCGYFVTKIFILPRFMTN